MEGRLEPWGLFLWVFFFFFPSDSVLNEMSLKDRCHVSAPSLPSKGDGSVCWATLYQFSPKHRYMGHLGCKGHQMCATVKFRRDVAPCVAWMSCCSSRRAWHLPLFNIGCQFGYKNVGRKTTWFPEQTEQFCCSHQNISTLLENESGIDSHSDCFYWKAVPDHHISIGYKTSKFLFK